ncbi:MAG: AMP-binding protein [Deltaproteobacteria bacterium]|nr:AMP-binding protein [Deltaproteobacteria bacterium]
MFNELSGSQLSENNISISWDEYLKLCYILSLKIPDTFSQNDKILPLIHSNIEGLIAIGASLLAGLVPVLAPEINKTACLWDPGKLDIKTMLDESISENIPEDSYFIKKGVCLCFLTSGSTGNAKQIEKHWFQLLSEALVLRDLYKIKPYDQILSLVSPFHIYGFLHGFLLSVLSGASVTFAKPIGGLFNLDEISNDIKLLVSVPAMWPLVENLLTKNKIDSVVSSSANFGSKREKLLLEYKDTDFYELYGSTETGGIGYRIIEKDNPFKTLKGVRLKKSSEDETMIMSEFIGKTWVPLADDLNLINKSKFIYKGRNDRIFKYGGKRFSLDKVENNLKNLISSCQIICHFKENDKSLKGGSLISYIEGDKLDLIGLRKSYENKYSEPFPSNFYFISKFPTGVNGKVSIDMLEKIREVNA